MRRRILAGIISIVLIGGGVYLLNSENSLKGQGGSQLKTAQMNDNFNKKVSTAVVPANEVQTPKEPAPVIQEAPTTQTPSVGKTASVGQKKTVNSSSVNHTQSQAVVSNTIQNKPVQTAISKPSEKPSIPLVQSCFFKGVLVKVSGVSVNIQLSK